MNTVGTPLLWSAFTGLMIIMLAIDLFLQKNCEAHSLNIKHIAAWSVAWVVLSMIFCFVLWQHLISTKGRIVADLQALSFLTGYLIEKAMSIDNIFVWLMLFNYFSVPTFIQRRILIYGVLGAIVLRTIMVFAGSWLINRFEWLLYISGAFLLFTAIKIAVEKEDKVCIGEKMLVKWLHDHLRMINTIDNEYFFIRKNNLLHATPLLLVLILLELSDVIFAVDSIPVIFAVTTDPFIALTSNLFAILGLRSMYFFLVGIAERFSMIKYGLSLILVFISIKMLIGDFYHISIIISLIMIFSIIVLTLIINACINYIQSKE